MKRRSLLGSVLLASAAIAATRAQAQVTVLALAVHCDLTLGPVLRALGDAYASASGVRVSVFPTQPGLVLPQLLREVQNDIVVTRAGTMDAAIEANIVAAGAPKGAWRNRLALAARGDTGSPLDGPIAVTDATSVADMDGPAILARLGLHPSVVLGVIDTDGVLVSLRDGAAKAGLLHMTDIRSHTDLSALRTVPDDVQPPFVYAAAVTRLARRPDPEAFIAFLATPQAGSLLSAHGLETNA